MSAAYFIAPPRGSPVSADAKRMEDRCGHGAGFVVAAGNRRHLDGGVRDQRLVADAAGQSVSIPCASLAFAGRRFRVSVGIRVGPCGGWAAGFYDAQPFCARWAMNSAGKRGLPLRPPEVHKDSPPVLRVIVHVPRNGADFARLEGTGDAFLELAAALAVNDLKALRPRPPRLLQRLRLAPGQSRRSRYTPRAGQS